MNPISSDEAGSLLYRMGVNSNTVYSMKNVQLFTQQIDLRREQYFNVVLTNMRNVQAENLIMVHNSNVSTKANFHPVFARCVVGAPFVYNRGHPNSVSFAQPTNISTIGIKLIGEDGKTLLQTNKQEISFTFGFVLQVK